MGHAAGFEEKEYETLMNAALALGNSSAGTSSSVSPALPKMFSPGQALERELGFDFSIYLDPSSTPYRLLYGHFCGHRRSTSHSGSQRQTLPTGVPVGNVFLQYKRPEYFGPRHRQPVFRRQSFLRFDARSRRNTAGSLVIDQDQLRALVRLADQEPLWLVRYACPAVWTRPKLYEAFYQSRLLEESAIVDPRCLVRPKQPWHNFWAFDPCTPGKGQGNPDGEIKSSQTGAEFFGPDTATTGPFLENLGKLQKGAESARRHDEEYFNQRVDNAAWRRAGHQTRNGWIGRTCDELESALLAHPVSISDSLPVVKKTLEVAATAAVLGLTWIVRT